MECCLFSPLEYEWGSFYDNVYYFDEFQEATNLILLVEDTF